MLWPEPRAKATERANEVPPQRARHEQQYRQPIRRERQQVLWPGIEMVGRLDLRRGAEGDRPGRFGQARRWANDEPAEDSQETKQRNRHDERGRDRLGWCFAPRRAEKDADPEARDVGERHRRPDHGQRGDDRTPLEAGGEEELVLEEADRQW